MKLLKLNLICIINCTASKNVLKFGLLIKKNYTLKTWVQQERRQLGSYWLGFATLTFLTFVALAGNPALSP